MLGEIKKIHFVGVGGIGMSGMAELLFNLGYKISGSDLEQSDITNNLEEIGIKVFIGHNKNNIEDIDLLVYSSAVNLDNVEIVKAKNNNIPYIKRAEMLGELLKVKSNSVAVAGTHGKTTTTSMLGVILNTAKIDPTIVVGGIVQDFKTNSVLGKGDTIIVEADEYDKTLLSLKPNRSIVTNIDLEHVDCYPNIDNLRQTFLSFLNSIPFFGMNVICYDDQNIKMIIKDIKRPYIKYGHSNECDVRYANPRYDNLKTSYDLFINNNKVSRINLKVPGKHNILNSLAAICIALDMEIPIDIIKKGLFKYEGVKRRFEIKEKISNSNSKLYVVDDYAHHPSEIKATIETAKSNFNLDKLIIVFQPHLYSRTKTFYKEFADSLSSADVVILTDIYPSREKKIDNVNSNMIFERLDNKIDSYLLSKTKIAKTIQKIISDSQDTMVIVMGAGDIKNIIPKIKNAIINKEQFNDK
tara:strand:- start:6474 stop:7880 length:1407 start_codon:yes stop_codon:yes gene_type:complete